ncbi:MAG TPA: hypothetical protein PLX28_00100 [Candidatus Woesebacteria bacterium]|nr:hypothetical protein [Candidatus Woesebacteria bacterium]HOI05308.1 hypothetical protein [Candidatus Woesebacteria bacterium]HPA61941.1 hypothetical protein [Candidatus Woesebacteria bacterium]HQO51182.1 hypothetical protein [Candidatus Woesebacteria bacterium]HUM57183.1 hypothetical protein [Candidatus Woesebacteria bacterium]
MTKKTKIIIAVSVLVALLIAGGIWFSSRGNRDQDNNEQPVTKQKITPKTNLIPVSERPFMQLEPTADGHYVVINVIEVKKPADSLNYEMEYQTGSMLQGFQGFLKLDQLPASDKKLFGSQSAGGAITYHEDIKGGSLLAEFIGPEAYAVKSSWRYFTNSDRQSAFSSQDTKFTIANDSLARYSYLIIYNSPGYPAEVEGEVVSDIYTVSAETSLKTISSPFTVTFTTKEEQAQIMGYDGEAWQSLESQYENGALTGSAPFMDAYLLVK